MAADQYDVNQGGGSGFTWYFLEGKKAWMPVIAQEVVQFLMGRLRI